MHELIDMDEDGSNPQIIRLLQEALHCSECGASRLRAMSEKSIKPRFLIECKECSHQGPLSKSLPDAITCWNKPIGLFDYLWKRFTQKLKVFQLAVRRRADLIYHVE